MADESWQQIRKIFDEALGRKVEEPKAFVLQACAGNKTLQAKVEAWLF